MAKNPKVIGKVTYKKITGCCLGLGSADISHFEDIESSKEVQLFRVPSGILVAVMITKVTAMSAINLAISNS